MAEAEGGYIKEVRNIEILEDKNLTISISNDKQIIKHFTKEEMWQKLSAIQDVKAKMFFEFLWRTGTRVTEAISLLKKDIDWQNDQITIRWLKSRKYNYRIIPLHKSLKSGLFIFTAKLNLEDRVFPMSRQRAHQLCVKYMGGHPHMIRHSFAIHFLRESKNPLAIILLKGLLGHESIQSTMVYLKLVPHDLKNALQEVGFDG